MLAYTSPKIAANLKIRKGEDSELGKYIHFLGVPNRLSLRGMAWIPAFTAADWWDLVGSKHIQTTKACCKHTQVPQKSIVQNTWLPFPTKCFFAAKGRSLIFSQTHFRRKKLMTIISSHLMVRQKYN